MVANAIWLKQNQGGPTSALIPLILSFSAVCFYQLTPQGIPNIDIGVIIIIKIYV